MVLTVISFSLLALQLSKGRSMDDGYGTTAKSLLFGLVRVAFTFSIGVLVCRFYRRRNRDVLGRGWSLILGALCFSVLVWVLCTSSLVAQTRFFPLAAGVLAFPLIVFCGAYIQLPPRLNAICVESGVISYPLYTLHGALYWPLAIPAVQEKLMAEGALTKWTLLGYCLFVVLVSWLVANYLEAPCRAYLSNRYKLYRSRSAGMVENRRA